VPTLFLVNADEPSQFAPRGVAVIPNDVEVAGQAAIAVTIEPVLDNTVGGPLQTAILVARRRNESIGGFLANNLDAIDVFVCRFIGDPMSLARKVRKEDVSIVFWGRLSRSLPRNR
jgi:hypothetical protein